MREKKEDRFLEELREKEEEEEESRLQEHKVLLVIKPGRGLSFSSSVAEQEDVRRRRKRSFLLGVLIREEEGELLLEAVLTAIVCYCRNDLLRLNEKIDRYLDWVANDGAS
jgi:hypothetical protein